LLETSSELIGVYSIVYTVCELLLLRRRLLFSALLLSTYR